MSKPTVDELLKQTATVQKGGVKCWAARLEGDAKLFVDGCVKKIDNREPFHPATALKIAQSVFDVDIKITAFIAHVKRRCCCYGSQTK
jgi:hypothetical protein